LYVFIIVILVLVIIGVAYYINAKNYTINITKVGQAYSEKELVGGWWFTVISNSDKRIKEYNIKLPDINFNTNNLVISDGREIKKMFFMKKSAFPFTKSHFANVLFGSELHSHTWFIYKIDKIDIYRDERSGEVKIEQ